MKYKQVFETVMDQSGVGPTIAAGPAKAPDEAGDGGVDQFGLKMRAGLTKYPLQLSSTQAVNSMKVHGLDPQSPEMDHALSQQLQQVGGALINPNPSKA